METIELYFTALCKGGEVLEARRGWYPTEEIAQDALEPECGNCYQSTIRWAFSMEKQIWNEQALCR